MDKPITEDIVVMYHGDCIDGFGGAWAAWKKFGDTAVYIPAFRGQASPEGLVNKEIYFIDFVYEGTITQELIKVNKRVTAVDHHETKKDITMLTKDYLFDDDHSAAYLAWTYFHPETPVPMLSRYIEDRDLWRFAMEDSLAITAIIKSSDFNFELWDTMSRDIETAEGRKKYAEKGAMLLAYEQRLVDGALQFRSLVEFCGHTVYAVNIPHYFASKAAGMLAKEKPPFGISWAQEKDYIHVSLRSDLEAEKVFDVSVLAKKYGGGGHVASSGFTVPMSGGFPWKIIHGSDEK